MRLLRVLWAVPVVALAMLVSACGSEDDQEQAQEQVQGQAPLTEDQVSAFIASFPVLRAMGERFANEFAGIADANNPSAANPFAGPAVRVSGEVFEDVMNGLGGFGHVQGRGDFFGRWRRTFGTFHVRDHFALQFNHGAGGGFAQLHRGLVVGVDIDQLAVEAYRALEPCDQCRESMGVHAIECYRDGLTAGGGSIQITAAYEVEVVDSMCSLSFEPNYSAPLSITQAGFGDVVRDCTGCPCGPPNLNISVLTDVISAINRFSNASCAPKKSRVEMRPGGVDFKIDFTDVLLILSSFTGAEYPLPAPADPCQ